MPLPPIVDGGGIKIGIAWLRNTNQLFEHRSVNKLSTNGLSPDKTLSARTTFVCKTGRKPQSVTLRLVCNHVQLSGNAVVLLSFFSYTYPFNNDL